VARLIHWFARLPITIVSANSLFAGLILSATEDAGWNDWGHEASIVMVVPIVTWAVASWWLGRGYLGVKG
jgi:hypothetical protein